MQRNPRPHEIAADLLIVRSSLSGFFAGGGTTTLSDHPGFAADSGFAAGFPAAAAGSGAFSADLGAAPLPPCLGAPPALDFLAAAVCFFGCAAAFGEGCVSAKCNRVKLELRS